MKGTSKKSLAETPGGPASPGTCAVDRDYSRFAHNLQQISMLKYDHEDRKYFGPLARTFPCRYPVIGYDWRANRGDGSWERLYCRDEKGPISLVKAAPDAFELCGQFDQPERSKEKAWPHLVIANARMYVRDQDILLCYDVKD